MYFLKNLSIIGAIVLISLVSNAQTIVFSDDFESGTSNWTLTGDWGLSTAYSNGGANSLADSPTGFYLNNVTSFATMTTGVDLSIALDANLEFYAIYDIENGFDYCYVEVSINGGTTWTNVATFNGQNNLGTWVQYTYSLGGYVGNSDVRVRFQWFSDPGLQLEGIFIDDMEITSFTTDNAPPLILHTPTEHYEGELDSIDKVFEIVDVSGVANAELYYTVDGSAPTIINAYDTTGNDYTFKVPAQSPGAWVEYWVTATDSAPAMNIALTPIHQYISGNYISYDNGIVSFINSYGFPSLSNLDGTAMRMTLGGSAQLVTALIRNYTDPNNVNDSMLFHVWADSNGNPGADLITPIMVYPEANVLFPNQMTRVDLRPYASQLSSLIGDVFIGFTVPVGQVFVVQTTPGTTGRVRNWNGTAWTNELDDYHFRAITGPVTSPPSASFVFDNTNDPTIAFTDLSTGPPSSWLWDFGNGVTDTTQNPSYTYPTIGNYIVCLTASNVAGTDQECQFVIITNTSPVADFSTDTLLDPIIAFTDLTQFSPTNWSWDFDDNGATSNIQNPVHIFSDSGTYTVCLIASNNIGGDTICKPVIVNTTLPIADFGYEVVDDTLVNFTDSSLNIPTSWLWDFDFSGATDTTQNPTFVYPITGGDFNVCLTASNQAGTSIPYCEIVNIEDLTIGIPENIRNNGAKLYPNPVSEYSILQLRDASNLSNAQLSVYSVLGQKVQVDYTVNNNQIIIYKGLLEAGTYLYELTVDGNLKAQGKMVVR